MLGVPVTLANCEDEPIHIPGAVQPHGVLLVCALDDLRIVQASANVGAYFPCTPAETLGRRVEDLFEEESAARMTKAMRLPSPRAANPLRVRNARGETFEAVLHRPRQEESIVVVEVEPSASDSGGLGFDPRLRAAIVQLQSATNLDSLRRIAADEVRSLTGFDRVMIYAFDASWNGEVIGESKADGLDSFLGQHYPASDIPAQARRLYELSWLRFIADVEGKPSPLVGRAGAPPLDMSFAVLRSVSPIHIQYLKNMGVTASMSISLLRGSSLAGLIACHHYSGPHRVPFNVRETCEYLGQALSWQLATLRNAELDRKARTTRDHEAEIMSSVARESELVDGLATRALVDLANAAGAAVVLQEGTRTVGAAPDAKQLAIIVDFLAGEEGDIFRSTKLAEQLPAAAAWNDFAAGLLAITISKELREYLLWFRPMTERTVDWAGNPDNAKLTTSDGAERLSPRGSFALWRQTVHGQSLPWEAWEVDGASSLRRLLLGGVRRRAAELRSLNARLLDADRVKNDFIATVSHELRTPLNAMAGWTHMLRKGNVAPELTTKGLDVISRNIEAQANLIEDLLDVSRISNGKLALEVENVDLARIIETAVQSASLAAAAKQVRIKTVLETEQTSILGDSLRLRQVVSNLLTNAIKFTAKGGSIRVSLRRSESDVELMVTDSGQGITPDFLPHIFDLFRQEDAGMNRRSQGLGLGLAIVKKLVALHGGRVWAESDGVGRGASFIVRLPLSPIRSASDPVATAAPLPPPPALAGLNVLVVEDEADSRDLIEHILQRAGMNVTAVADATAGLEVLTRTARSFDLIVSDIGLPVVDGISFMRVVRQRPAAEGGRLPSVALTAHTRAVDRTRVLQAGFNAHVPKPVDPDELLAVLTSVLRFER